MTIIIKCGLIPKGFCVNLLGTFWSRDVSWIDKYVVNHERIHTAQQRELLFLPFYVLYLLEWLLLFMRFRNWHKAYVNISFEKEAYGNGRDLHYLSLRRHFAQWRKS